MGRKLKFAFEIGDNVKVVNTGYNYSTYFKKYKEMGFKKPNSPKGIYNDKSKVDGVVFKVFALGIHNEFKRIKLYGIEDKKGNQFLFSKSGLKTAI